MSTTHYRVRTTDPKAKPSRLLLLTAVVVTISVILTGSATAATASAIAVDTSSSGSTTTSDAVGTTLSPDGQPADQAATDPAAAHLAETAIERGGAEAASGRCGGRLPLGKVKSCTSISGTQENTWRFTSAVDQDTILVRLKSASGEGVSGRITDSAGATVCTLGPYLNECRLGAAGEYRATVSLYYGTGTGSYTLSAESVKAPSKCVRLPDKVFSFASPGRPGTLPDGLSAACFTFNQPTGTVLLSARPSGTGDLRGNLLDGDHQVLCNLDYVGWCELTRPGPYRIFLNELYGNGSNFTIKLPRLSQPVGCQALPMAAFGDPGAAVGTGLLDQGAASCHSLETTAPGAVVVRFDGFADQYLNWTMYDLAGTQICDEWSSARSCMLPAAGGYTLLAQSSHWDPVPYQVAVTSMSGLSGCAEVTGTNWDQPTLVVHQTSAVQVNCQPFQGETGDRVIVYRAPDAYNQLFSWLVDENGTPLCTGPADQAGCSLPTSGTFRVISHLGYWEPEDTDLTYRMQVRRLSDPVGCPSITPGAYNAAPAGGLDDVRCRMLDVPAAGVYRVKAIGADNYRQYGNVYDSSGQQLCTDVWCELPAAGQYTFVLGGDGPDSVLDDLQYALALLPYVPSDCPAVSDTGLQDLPYQGEFSTIGQHDCLQLASPAGSRMVAMLPGDATGAGSPEIIVLDSTGEYICDSSWGLHQYHCELTGTAPFFAVLSLRNGAPTGPYALAFARTDGPPACPVLLADTDGVSLDTGADRFAVCFSIPADQRHARESITYQRTSGTGNARLSVFDATGLRYCGPSGRAATRTITCQLPPGAVTVMLETDAVPATYRLTYRDADAPPE